MPMTVRERVNESNNTVYECLLDRLAALLLRALLPEARVRDRFQLFDGIPVLLRCAF